MENTGELARSVWRVGVKGDAVGSRAREGQAGEEKDVFSREDSDASRGREGENCGSAPSWDGSGRAEEGGWGER